MITLLGHTGFIGQTVYKLIKAKGLKITGISSKEINFLHKNSSSKLLPFLGDDTTLIISIAINRELGDNVETLQQNIKIISNIAKALTQKPIKKCVYLSTADIYGHPNETISENTAIDPKTYYAISKFCCEKILEVATEQTGIPLLILRYNGVWGPGQKNIGYGINFFIDSINKEGRVTFWGRGEEERDALYVKDLSKIIVDISLSKSRGIYNIARGKSISFADMVRFLKKLSPKKFRIYFKKRTTPNFNQKFNIEKLKKTLPKIYFTPLETSLKETFNLTFKQNTKTWH